MPSPSPAPEGATSLGQALFSDLCAGATSPGRCPLPLPPTAGAVGEPWPWPAPSFSPPPGAGATSPAPPPPSRCSPVQWVSPTQWSCRCPRNPSDGCCQCLGACTHKHRKERKSLCVLSDARAAWRWECCLGGCSLSGRCGCLHTPAQAVHALPQVQGQCAEVHCSNLDNWFINTLMPFPHTPSVPALALPPAPFLVSHRDCKPAVKANPLSCFSSQLQTCCERKPKHIARLSPLCDSLNERLADLRSPVSDAQPRSRNQRLQYELHVTPDEAAHAVEGSGFRVAGVQGTTL